MSKSSIFTMICVQSSFVKDFDDIVCDAHGISDEFQRQIYHVKCQVTNLVHKQIQRLKNRKDLLHFVSRQTLINSSENSQMDPRTKPFIDSNSATDNLLNNAIINESYQADASTMPLGDDQTETVEVDTETADIDIKTAEVVKGSRIFALPPASNIRSSDFSVKRHIIPEHQSSPLIESSQSQNSQLLDQGQNQGFQVLEPGQSSQHISPDQSSQFSALSQSFQFTGPWNRLPQFSKRTKKFVSAVVIGFLVWIALVYGAVLGASLCSSGFCFLTSSRRPTVF